MNKNKYVLEKTLQFNSKEDFLKSDEHKKMLAEHKIFDVEEFSDFTNIRIYKLEETRITKIMFHKTGKGSDTTRITLPITWVRALDLTEDDRIVTISIKDKEITIKKLEDVDNEN